VQRGLEWDEEQKEMIEEFHKRKEELDQKYGREQLKEGLGPKSWVPGTKAEEPAQDANEYDGEGDGLISDDMRVAVVNELELMEQSYLQEYEKVYLKDQDGNKDLNNLAIEELKRAQYFFAYMRQQEKSFNKEIQMKKQEEEMQASLKEMSEEERIQVIQR